jgi:predicted alpha/beta hydrolase family esterase
MKNVVILHGKPTRERYENPQEPKPHEANWLPWLGRQLQSQGIDVAIPALPKPYSPVYDDWKAVFEENIVGKGTALVGHSAGAEFILRWMSENRYVSVEKAVLVAPYRDFEGKHGEFSQYTLDTNIADRIGRLTIFNSLDDDAPIQRRVHELTTCFADAELIELDGYGHFRLGHNMNSEEFPLLLETLQQQ